MIKRLYIDGFRSLVNFDLALDSLVLLAGLNGSGKSSVFDVLEKLSTLISGTVIVDQIFESKDLTKWQDKPIQQFGVDFGTEMGLYQYALAIEHNLNERKPRIQSEKLALNGAPLFEMSQGMAQLYHDDHSKGPAYPGSWSMSGVGHLPKRADNKRITDFRDALSKVVLARISPAGMSADAPSEDNWPDSTMSNFASWFRYLSQEHQGNVLDLTNELREVIPGFHSFQLKQAGEETRTLSVLIGGESGNGPLASYPFNQLSDGQRVLIVLYTLLFALKDLGYVLLLDEPENYVALPEIQPWLMALKEACNTSIRQAIIVSHHPELLNYLGSSSGRWLERTPDGPTRIMNLADARVEGLTLAETIARGWQQ